MLVLLPPSEGKTAPVRGRPVDLGRLAYADALATRRAQLLEALAELCGGGAGARADDEALAALGLSAGQAEWLARDAALLRAPAARASTVYTGVLYERLDLPSLPAPARRRVLIASALWGVVRPDDRIPAYKLSMDARLPGVGGGLAAFWRPALREALPDRGLVVDMRSGAYAAAWAPATARVLAVRAFTEGPGGTRKAVSHWVKATRGEVARVLLEASPPPRTPERAAAIVEASGRRVELGPGTLDVIEAAR